MQDIGPEGTRTQDINQLQIGTLESIGLLSFEAVVVPFIFHILVRYETFITRAQGPVIVIAKEEV